MVYDQLIDYDLMLSYLMIQLIDILLIENVEIHRKMDGERKVQYMLMHINDHYHFLDDLLNHYVLMVNDHMH